MKSMRHFVAAYVIMFVSIVAGFYFTWTVHMDQRHVLIQRCHARTNLFDLNYDFWTKFEGVARNPQVSALIREHVQKLRDASKEDCSTP